MANYYIDPTSGNDANDGGGFFKLAFAAGSGAQPAAGEVVTGEGGATAKIIKVTGTWGTSGTLYLYNRNATAFANGEALTFSGGGACLNAQGDAINSAFKTLKKTFAAADVINVLKNVEAVQAGTVTAGAFPALTLSTTNDLTGVLAQYDIIRLTSGGVLDPTIYMVKAITSTVITLYRCYRGTAEAGKSIYKLTPATCSSGDWAATSGDGTAASHITLQGGINPSDLTQDGFTVLEGAAGSLGYSNAKKFYDVSRMGFRNFGYCWGGSGSAPMTDGTLSNCYAFRAATYGWNQSVRTTVNTFVFEKAKCNTGANNDGVFNDWEVADDAAIGMILGYGICNNNIWNRLRITGYASYASFSVSTSLCTRNRFNDCVFDENNAGCTIFSMASATPWMNNIFYNLMVGSGTLLTVTNTPWGWLSLQNLNGVANDNRQYYFLGESSKYVAILSRETTVFNTASPAGKVALNQSLYPFPVNFEIPCDAGVQKTISVYLRKNSSYGSATLPFMRLRWVTGTAGAYVMNQYDVAMADTNDTYLQVSHAVTPAIQGTIKVTLFFQSANASAIGYFDDLLAA